ncbi:hypothetical protein BLS_009901 [Venturia inaequalis]|uniref:Carotenoid oxygenase n=1 Tax=Venturia inaequalis TaxID=5025 RepID=A0A8H3Z9Z1_VENIN|nr:hypothetical protein BLS_009901 [Venturia inaequalis]KAE9985797.1 hypothetical protein EG328_006918 [Venturia inaequalis]KAE9993953.1 hypothetical protein EG327_002287 [Venturia inaequalis]
MTVLPAVEVDAKVPYNDWPNELGFQTDFEQNTPTELKVDGTIPSYAVGTLYRTGPGRYKVDGPKHTFKVSHWFDGFETLHRFQILQDEDGEIKVIYNSRNTVDQLILNVEKTGVLDNVTFAQKREPCQSYFSKVMSVFWPAGDDSGRNKNVGVTLSINHPGAATSQKTNHASGIRHLTLKTDAMMLKSIDPVTLEPIGWATQSSLHPQLKGHLSGAHAKSDPITGNVYNYNLDIVGTRPTYRVFCTSAATGKTTILAQFIDKAAYLHSLFLTEDHVVLCIWNSHLSMGGLSIVQNLNILDSISTMDPWLPARWYVIDRKHGKGILATYESAAFFAFHTINAWIEPSPSDPSATDIICTLSAYDDTDVLKKFYYENLLSTSLAHKDYIGERGDSARPELRQYRLHAVPSTKTKTPPAGRITIDFSAPKQLSLELPTINPNYLTKANRYTYGITDRSKSRFVDGLGKFDAITKTTLFWEKHAHTPGEAIFVPEPGGKNEDDGVLLSVVLDGIKGSSYLLCLDARSMSELGRAEVDGAIGFGFHGAFWNGRSCGV